MNDRTVKVRQILAQAYVDEDRKALYLPNTIEIARMIRDLTERELDQLRLALQFGG